MQESLEELRVYSYQQNLWAESGKLVAIKERRAVSKS